MLGNSKKSIGPLASRTEPKTASAAMALLLPRWLLPPLCPLTPQRSHPGPWGEREGWGGTEPGTSAAGGSGQTVYSVYRQHRASHPHF